MRKPVIFLLFVIFLSPQFLWGTDLLILKKPRALTIYNHFQQPLTDEEWKSIPLNAPMIITNNDGLLGDQISHAFQCHYRGSIFYILKDDKGAISCSDASAVKRLIGARLLDDTLILAKPLAVSDLPAPSAHTSSLDKGTIVILRCEYRGFLFVQPLDGTAAFGWCLSSAKASMRTPDKKQRMEIQPLAGLSDAIRQTLFKRISVANATYQKLFESYNATTGNQKAAPQWALAGDSSLPRWELTNPYRSTDELTESSMALARDMQSALIGTGYTAVFQSGTLIIRLREQ